MFRLPSSLLPGTSLTKEPSNSLVDPSLSPLSPPLSAPAPDEKSKGSTVTEPYIHLGNPSDDFLDIFNSADMMAGTGSHSPYIKDEPDDHLFSSPHPSNFIAHHQRGFDQHDQQMMGAFGHSHGSDGSIDPAELTMHGESLPTQNGAFTPSFPSFGAQQNLSFTIGNSGIADDELLDLGNLNQVQTEQDDFFTSPTMQHQQHPNMPQQFQDRPHVGSLTVNTPGHLSAQLYSPGQGAQIAPSPFAHHQHTNFDHVRPAPVPHQGQPLAGYPMKAPSSSFGGSMRPQIPISTGSLDQRGAYVATRARAHHHSFERNGSHPRSPLTPKTPSMGVSNMTLGTPDSGSFPQPIQVHQHLGQHDPQRTFSSSNQWEGQSGSLHSHVDSPLSSPGRTSYHAQISDILGTGKPASLPANVENGSSTTGGTNFQTQEAKRRRRRESHNMVERRRRDNINERIQELSHLVPQHRLEDERVRKHLLNNSPLSPSLGPTGMSPPQATSLLAGGIGRRAAGSLSTGIPVEDKDKGPNKGDILNGSVSWTRDLMWALHAKFQQESELASYINSLGGTWPFEQTEEEKRMRTELLDAMEKNDASTFTYSRAPGSGLRVPKHTNLAGDPMMNLSGVSPTSLSPANISGGSRNVSVGLGHNPFLSGQSSGGSGQNSIGFKEEEEYRMEME
ncbi:MAG: hypothetical protein M1816_002580 [Peltula sp. TS41687]|nr:MAG: hypothetical protein M1816_002580 [Peltula sp. TS41687]